MSDTNQTPEGRTTARIECDKALHCLYVAVDESVARSVNEKVYAHINALERELSEAKQDAFNFARECGLLRQDKQHLQSSLHQLRQVADGLALFATTSNCQCHLNARVDCPRCRVLAAYHDYRTIYHNLNKPQEKKEW